MICVAYLSEAAAEAVTATSTGTGRSCPVPVGDYSGGVFFPYRYSWAHTTAVVLCDIATVMDRLVAPVYLLLTMIAIITLASPFCRSLSLHGKVSVDGGRGSGGDGSRKEGGEGGRVQKSCTDDSDGLKLGGSTSTRPRAIADAILHGSAMRVKKRRFGQFYVLGVAGSACALLFRLSSIMSGTARGSVLDYTLACNSNQQVPSAAATSVASRVLLGAAPLVLLLSHVCRRLYECHRVHQWRDDGRGGTMHLAGYIVGMVHYLFLPLVFLDFGSKNCADTSGEDRCVVGDDESEKAVLLEHVLWICAGTALCLWSQAVQNRHHVILADLRRPDPPIAGGDVKNGESSSMTDPSPVASSSPSPTKNGIGGSDAEGASFYRLPTGGWFDNTSSPHYLAEIMIYLSFFITLHCGGAGSALPLLGPGECLQATAGSGWRGLSSPSGLSEESLLSAEQFRLLQFLRRVLGEEVWELLDQLSRYKSLFLLLWVVTNLSISASRSHAFYLRHFGGGDYDSRKSSENGNTAGRRLGQSDAQRRMERRAALIPFIW